MIGSGGAARDKQGQQQQLTRQLGMSNVFAIAAGAMISSGLFVLPGLAFASAGPAVFVAYLLAAICYLPALFATAELATAMPKSGGTYYFIERSLGSLPGTLVGLANWISISLKAAFAFIGIGAIAAALFPQVGMTGIKAIAVVGCIVFALINVIGVQHAGNLQRLLVVFLLGLLVLYLVIGMPSVHPYRFYPFLPAGWRSLAATIGLVFVSFGGLTKVADVSGEVANPKRNLPWGMLLAFLVVNALYFLVVFTTVGILDAPTLAGSLTPIAEGARRIAGPWGFAAMSIAAGLAFATTGNAGILSASRSPMAMSADGLLPGQFARVSKRGKTPYVAIAITALFIALVVSFLSLEDLVKTASTMLLVAFLLMCVAVVIMCRAKLPSYRPSFRVPLQPYVSIVGVVIYGFLIVDMGTVPLATSGAFFAAALVWYLFYVRMRIRRESTATYVMRRILLGAEEEADIEKELVDLAFEGAEVEPDAFDEMIRRAPILDIEGNVDQAELCDRIARSLVDVLGMSERRLRKSMQQCPAFTEAVVEHGIALPHLILSGRNLYEVVLIRSKEGMQLPHVQEPVHAAFVLAHSPDMKRFHLQVLMAIARVVHEKHFQEEWRAAKHPEQLRNLVLVSKRRRMDEGSGPHRVPKGM